MPRDDAEANHATADDLVKCTSAKGPEPGAKREEDVAFLARGADLAQIANNGLPDTAGHGIEMRLLAAV